MVSEINKMVTASWSQSAQGREVVVGAELSGSLVSPVAVVDLDASPR